MVITIDSLRYFENVQKIRNSRTGNQENHEIAMKNHMICSFVYFAKVLT